MADDRPFLVNANLAEARYYDDDIGPIIFLGMDKDGKPTSLTTSRLVVTDAFGLACAMMNLSRPSASGNGPPAPGGRATGDLGEAQALNQPVVIPRLAQPLLSDDTSSA